MTATDDLRRMLDERGESWHKWPDEDSTTWQAYSDPHTATESMDGTLIVTGLTPEQAIAATLGDTDATCERHGDADERDQLKTENAKLWELITDVHESLKADKAGMFHNLTLLAMEDDMRELGVEVDG